MRRVYKNLYPATISASIMAANMWKNRFKNVESENNKIFLGNLNRFCLQRNWTYFLNKPLINGAGAMNSISKKCRVIFSYYYALNVQKVFLALCGSVLQHPTSATCLAIVTSSCRLRTIRRVMWRHNLSPMQWQQLWFTSLSGGSACSPRDRLSQPSLTSTITVVCVSLIQESNCSRKQATSATAPYPSLYSDTSANEDNSFRNHIR